MLFRSVIKQLKELKDKAEKQGTDNKRDAIDKGIKKDVER